MLVLTSDTFRFMTPEAVVRRCGTLRRARELADSDAPVPLPNVSTAAMTRLVRFYTHLGELELGEEGAAAITAWKLGFFEGLGRPDLYELMEAANFLDADALLDDACAYVADLIRGCSPNKIREILLLPQDLTSEESRKLAAEFAWALK